MSKMHLSSFHWSAYLTAPDTDGIYGGGSLGTRTDVFKALFVTADADKGNWPSSDMSVGSIIHIEEKKLSGIWRLLEASSTDYNSSPDEVTMLLNNVSVDHFDGICWKMSLWIFMKIAQQKMRDIKTQGPLLLLVHGFSPLSLNVECGF